MTWENELSSRLENFRQERGLDDETLIVSVKVRVTSGCFHREHSPQAYSIIDEIDYPKTENKIIEHENGPEVIAYIALATASISFLQSTISLITEILKARQQGVSQGDNPNDSLKVIVRGFDKKGRLREEEIVEVHSSDPLDKKTIERTLNKTLKEFKK
ncbi:MAG TPA: hypothetical protein VKA34_15755 [Balneolales bacterium]|nr:hypothetical protein [Balneolales bacterium]